jgi:hypothetical protein
VSIFDEALSGISSRMNTTSLVGRAMGLVRRLRDSRLRSHIVGCYPVQKKRGLELVLYVDSPIWAQEFQLGSSATLVEWNRLCQASGYDDLKAASLRFQVSSRVHAAPVADDVATDTYEPASLLDLNPAERDWVESQLASISDPQLKEKARQALMASLRWKKTDQSQKGGN